VIIKLGEYIFRTKDIQEIDAKRQGGYFNYKLKAKEKLAKDNIEF
jgi:hypothetical protein